MHLIDCHAPLCDCSMAAFDLWVYLPLHHRTDPGHVCIWAQPCLSCFLERVNMTNFCSTKSHYIFVDFEFVLWLLAKYTLLKWMEANLQKPILFSFLFFYIQLYFSVCWVMKNYHHYLRWLNKPNFEQSGTMDMLPMLGINQIGLPTSECMLGHGAYNM